ncbi:MAG TPA: hypothetical protein VN966_03660 [Candidatus Bathyarchaeia archaeon]|nr:hypothetical protein [Candidatus Bathyarchaeia archaeon]
MFNIRKEQLDALSQASLKSFEERVVTHLRKFFAPQCIALGDIKVRETIHLGIERAKSYGITTERDVCKYTDLMVAFGSDFDRDPSLAWAQAILSDPELENPAEKIDALYDQGMASFV